MKDLTLRLFHRYQVHIPGFAPHPLEGVFQVPSVVDGGLLRIIASATAGWDHVSVSLATRCPTWTELEQVKRLFFWPNETAMQLHVPPAEHVNNSNFCLHLWRPQLVAIPRPPAAMVGLPGRSPAEIEALKMGVFHT